MVTVQPTTINISQRVSPQQWSSGLCDCCDDMGICCCGFWCCPCQMCKTTADFGECLCLPLIDIMFGCFVPPISLSVRSSMRERYNIKGSMCTDCCKVSCCGPCSWCQMARELKKQRQPRVVTYNLPSAIPRVTGPPYSPMPSAPQ
ncbi:cornifelin homolog A-like [Chanos chanos]|uniref:Cornifelin homolog A-like n=1 Tax=Chanos chanos TaxID=29144 RepID=A0A6J2VTS5_CHACN|nr:cornifelin homolog A-like [Chanos chanos]